MYKNGETINSEGYTRLRMNSKLGLLDAARYGVGVTCLPTILARPAVEAGTILSVLDDWYLTPLEISAVYPSKAYLPAKVKCFIDHAILMHGYNTSLAASAFTSMRKQSLPSMPPVIA
jgi:DNA-binding transcriptional LysR family regulator